MPHRQRAFTLVEISIALLIVGLLLALAVPAFGNVIASAQLRTATADLSDDLARARREAIGRASIVRACPSPGGRRCVPTAWHGGWIVTHDGIVLAVHDPLPRSLAAVGTDGRPAVVFERDGAAGGANATVTLCVRKRPSTAVSVVVSSAGRIHQEPAKPAHAAACASSREIKR